MFFHYWDVLVVDDEPDVLAVTKLALRDMRVYGLPLRIHTAATKAEAVDLLYGMKMPGAPETMVAVALVDVVMETDHAGLELCEFIRKDLGNQYMQVYIRTGQPGVAPERKVIDEYDISGYFTKVEATEQKLYTLVKTGVRQWLTYGYALGLLELTNQEVAAAGSRKALVDYLKSGVDSFADIASDLCTGFIIDGQWIADDPDKVKALVAELGKVPPIFSTKEGHSLVVDGKRHMVRVKGTARTADYTFAADLASALPPALYQITFQNGLVLSTLYKRAGAARAAKPAAKKSARPKQAAKRLPKSSPRGKKAAKQAAAKKKPVSKARKSKR